MKPEEKITKDLCEGRRIDKTRALADIQTLAPEERLNLRALLEQALAREFPPSCGESARLDGRAKTWMVHAFTRLHADDAAYPPSVLAYLDPAHEQDDWVRYWALAGLIDLEPGRPASPALLAACRKLDDPRATGESKAWALARVLLVRDTGHDDAPVRAAIAGYSEPHDILKRGACNAMLRALRIVPLPRLLNLLCEQVEDNPNPSVELAYEAAVALGQLGAHVHRTFQGSTLNPRTQEIATALHALVGFTTDRFYMDMARWAALRSLGQTRAEISVPILLAELSDDNPIIAQSSGKALQQILQTPAAVELIVKEVILHKRPAVTMAEALRGMDRGVVVETLLRLAHELPHEQRPEVQDLLVEFGGALAFERIRAQSQSLSRYDSAMKMIRENFLANFSNATTDARRWAYITLGLDFLLYIVGIGLLVVSAWLALGERNLEAVTAAVGSVGAFITTRLIGEPRKLITGSIHELVHLEAVFAAYIRELHQIDLSFVQRILDGRSISPAELGQQAELLRSAMRDALKALAEGRSAAITSSAQPPRAG